jgi:hypothetical protein
MRSFPDETGSTPALCEEVVASQGFCSRHARRMFHLGKSHSAGTAVAASHLELLERRIGALQCELYSLSRNVPAIRGRVKSARRPRSNRSVPAEAWESQINPGAACSICRFECGAEYQAMTGLVAQLDDPAFRESYTATDGLCLPHLRMALGKADTEGKIFLAKAAHNKVVSLLDLVMEYTRKHSWHFRQEPKLPQEQQALIRTIRFQVGEPECF